MDARDHSTIYDQRIEKLQTILLEAFKNAAVFVDGIPPLRSPALEAYIARLNGSSSSAGGKKVSAVDAEVISIFHDPVELTGFKEMFGLFSQSIDKREFQDSTILGLLHPENPQGFKKFALENDENFEKAMKVIHETESALQLYKLTLQNDGEGLKLFAKIHSIETRNAKIIQMEAARNLTYLIGFYLFTPEV